MAIPKKWGQGALFAFSALDGESLAGCDFSGTLCGDKIGIRFYTKVRRELIFAGTSGSKPIFETVTGDSIVISSKYGEMRILFADAHTVIGKVAGEIIPMVFTEGNHQTQTLGDTLIQDTFNGEFTAILRKGDLFSFSFGSTAKEAEERALFGISLDQKKILERNLAPFDALDALDAEEKNPLLAKCLSVMKTQLYSPEGIFRQIWSTPDRLPHKRLWLWDSVFHAIGFRNLYPSLAQDLILSVLDCQREDGFIPHMALPDKTSSITQPPVLAWGAFLVFEKSKDADFLATVFQSNHRFLSWCEKNRRESEEELYTWLTGDNKSSRCDECGMDNSPRFDLEGRLQAIDFSCFMANEARYMAKIACLLGKEDLRAHYQAKFETIRDDINRKLYCKEDGFYYDFDLNRGCLHKVESVASFLPLFSGICSKEQAEALVNHLENPETFATPFPIPSISRRDPSYGSDMWRGPVWLNYNYMIQSGLREQGFDSLADHLRDRTLDAVDLWYQKKGVTFEFYDPENQASPGELNRKGPTTDLYDFGIKMQAVRDFGWTSTLTLDLIYSKYQKQ